VWYNVQQSGTTIIGQSHHAQFPTRSIRTRKLPPWVGSRTLNGGIPGVYAGEDVKEDEIPLEELDELEPNSGRRSIRALTNANAHHCRMLVNVEKRNYRTTSRRRSGTPPAPALF